MATVTYEISNDPTIRLEAVGGDLEIEGSNEAEARLEIRGNVRPESVNQDGNQWVISARGGDVSLRVPAGATVVVYRVGGDTEVRNVALLEAATIGGDLEVEGVRQIRIDAVGGDAELICNGGQATIGRVGGDLEVARAEQLTVGIVGGDAELHGIETLRGLEKVGGDLELGWSGRLEGEVNIKVGGDAEINLTDAADFNLQATVRGDIEGQGKDWQVEGTNGALTATFGGGAGTLHLRVGGDLEITGGAATNTSFSTNDWTGRREPFRNFGGEMRSFGREMEGLARELSKELGSVGREVRREVLREVLRGGERGGKPGRPRVQVRVNNREFEWDPEQIERIKHEAQAAAANGIARAQEAVMRAFSNLGVPTPPNAPTPPRTPQPPTPPFGFTGQTVRIDREQPAPTPGPAPAPTSAAESGGESTAGADATADRSSAQPAAEATPNTTANPTSNPDQERLAILRMVAAGQIKPTEAEVLLRSLEQTA